MTKAVIIGWIIFLSGSALWLYGYFAVGHQSIVDWHARAPWWIADFLPNLESELGMLFCIVANGANVLATFAKINYSARNAFSLGDHASLNERRSTRYDKSQPLLRCSTEDFSTQSAEKRRPRWRKTPLLRGRRLKPVGFGYDQYHARLLEQTGRANAHNIRCPKLVILRLAFPDTDGCHGEFKIAERRLNFGRKRRARGLCFVPSFCK